MTAAAQTQEVAVDWGIAGRRARSLVPAGPKIDRAQAALLVESLRSAASRAPDFVGQVTGLHDAAAASAKVATYIVDRPSWIDSNIATFAHITDGVLPAPPNRHAARVAGEELGVVLPLLASRVLGQYDPFATETGGRLLLVAPNILKVEKELELPGPDFHLWVALHEQTHALQGAAAPWLADYLAATMRKLMSGVLASDGAEDRVRSMISALPDVVTGASDGDPNAPSSGPLLDAVLSDDERELMDQAVALMSLLEGHADVVMDEVGPDVVPAVARIRKAFDKRRTSPGPIENLLRRLLGMDAKLAQYRRGAKFVRAVIADVGHDGLNAVWSAPEQLPTAAEIADPALWVARVHG